MTASEPAQRPAYEPVTRLLRPTAYDPDMRRPAATVSGAVLVILRAMVGVLWIVDLLLHRDAFLHEAVVAVDGASPDTDLPGMVLAVTVTVVGAAAMLDAVLAVFILRGSNLARVTVMVVGVVSICTDFAGWWAGGQEITLRTTLPSVAFDVLVLLALSSREAAAYARRNEKR